MSYPLKKKIQLIIFRHLVYQQSMNGYQFEQLIASQNAIYFTIRFLES